MAGSPYGVPAGTIGPRSMDLSPYFNQWQMRQQAGLEAERRAQQQQQFAREMEFRNTAQQTGQKLSELQMKQGDRELASREKLSLENIRQRELDRAASEQARLQGIELRKQESQQAMDMQKSEVDARNADRAARDAKAAEAQAKIDAEKKQAEERKQREVAVEVETRSFVDNIAAKEAAASSGVLTAESMASIISYARKEAQAKYGSDPDLLAKALDAIDRWEAGQYARSDIRAKQEDRAAQTEARAMSNKRMVYNSILDSLIKIEEQLSEAEAYGDEAAIQRLTAMRDTFEGKLAKLEPELGLSDAASQ